jgi:hypothetical protein
MATCAQCGQGIANDERFFRVSVGEVITPAVDETMTAIPPLPLMGYYDFHDQHLPPALRPKTRVPVNPTAPREEVSDGRQED